MNRLLGAALAVFMGLSATGCMTAAEHRTAVQDDKTDRLTVGTVQREIKVGMPASEVARVLGSPNIVTTDENRREVWIYDKIATDRVYSTSQGGVSTLVLGGALVGSGLVGGAVAPYYGQSAGAASTSQRTLTVIIKYDEQMKVRDFAYHTSRF
jgi:outer membrane protein assembly factor BamE (lipoprotein component of BamABCDE complex)